MSTSLRLLVAATVFGLVGCQQPAPPAGSGAASALPMSLNGTGYMLFNAPITPASRNLFVADLQSIANAGAKTIHIGLNSPGGQIDAAQDMVADMARLHSERGIDFEVYNIGMVASAATYVFLNAQRRYTSARGAFLFHAAGVVSTGAITSQTLREQADKLDQYENTMRATLKARTRLTDGESLTYVRRTVVLNADDARRDGVVDGVAEFSKPNNVGAWTIQATRRATPPGSTPPGSTPPASTPPQPAQ